MALQIKDTSHNHHLHTLAGLVVAAREMKTHGRDYAAQTVKNAKALGRALTDQGVPVEARDFGFTERHQIAVDVAKFGGGVEVARRLEAQDVIVNYNMLPGDQDPRQPSGLRIGVQEMTRFGMRRSPWRCRSAARAAPRRASNAGQ